MSKAALSSMEWRSIRIPFARSATARRPKTPSRSWLREAARCYPFRVISALAPGVPAPWMLLRGPDFNRGRHDS
jgi:hypothetical protein